MNPLRWIGLILVAMTLAIAGWLVRAPIAIFYHQHKIALADKQLNDFSKAQIRGESIDVPMQSKVYARRMRHCDRLVALGYYFHASYELNKLPSSEFRKYQDAILVRGAACPASPERHWGISVSGDHFVINVYDRVEFKSQWDKFAESINDPTIATQPKD